MSESGLGRPECPYYSFTSFLPVEYSRDNVDCKSFFCEKMAFGRAGVFGEVAGGVNIRFSMTSAN